MTSVGPQMKIFMKTNSQERSRRFSLTWTSVPPECGGRITEQTHGTIQSPNYPGHYPHNRDCRWTIFASYGKRIQFHFATLNIEHHPNCSADYLKVTDGILMPGNPHYLAVYCSSIQPPPLTTTGHVATVLFHSDNSSSDTGFVATWSEVAGIPGCGGLLTEPTAEFSSPSHPETYTHNLNCEWVIRLPVGDRIKLTFLSFDVEDHTSCK